MNVLTSEPWLRRLLWGCVVALYVLAFPYQPGLRSPNELARMYQTMALVDFGTNAIGTGECPSGFARDPNTVIGRLGPVGDLACYKGKFYSSKAPLLSFAAVPIYWVLKRCVATVTDLAFMYWARLFLTVLPTLLMLVWVRRFLAANVAEPLADGLTATYALGTLAFSYSQLFMSHQTTTVLLFAAFYALWRFLRGEWGWKALILTGAAAGASVMAEYTTAAAVVCLALYAVIAVMSGEGTLRERGLSLAKVAGIVAVSSAPFLGGLLAYHAACFGGPLESAYTHLAQPEYQQWHLGGFMGIRLPSPTALGLSFFSPSRGLFALAPFLVLGIPGLFLLQRRTRGTKDVPLFWLSALMSAWYAYFTASFSYESWGWTTGPRHLTGLVPFLLLPVAVVLSAAAESPPARRIWLPVCAGLCAAAVVVTGTATFVNYIPPEVSTPLFGLAVPLFREGDLPPNVLYFLGVGALLSGGFMLFALVAAAVLVARRLVASWSAMVGVAAVCAAYFALLAVATQRDPGNEGAFNLLKQVWVMRP